MSSQAAMRTRRHPPRRSILDRLESRLLLDTTAPRIISSSIQEGDSLTGPSLAVTIRFDEPVSIPNPFGIILRRLGVVQARNPSTWSYDAPTSTLTANFIGTPDDRYSLTLESGNGKIEDLAGNDLDGEPRFPAPPNTSGDGIPGGNFVVNFEVDYRGELGVPPLNTLRPNGSHAHEISTGVGISNQSDLDLFRLDLQAGQRVGVIFRPSSTSSLRARIELLDPAGQVVASASASAARSPTYLQIPPVPAAGTYRIAVSSLDQTWGTGNLDVVLNAYIPIDVVDNFAHYTPQTAIDLDPVFSPVSTDASQTRAVVASATAFGYYRFTANAGDTLSAITYTPGSNPGPFLTILDADGAVIASDSGASPFNPYGTIRDLLLRSTGTFYARTTGSRNFILVKNAAVESENNDTPAAANPIHPVAAGPTRILTGRVAIGDGGDWFRIQANAGVPITLATSTPGDAPGLPDNTLDPLINLFDASQSPLASDDDSAPDARNATLTYTPQTDQTLLVQVTRKAGGVTDGDYLLHVTNHQPIPPLPLTVTATSPTPNQLRSSPTGFIHVTFSRQIDFSSLDWTKVHVTGPAGPVRLSGIMAPNATQITFVSTPSMADGTYTVSLQAGALRDLQGAPAEPHSFTFSIDATAPRLVGSSIRPGDVLPPGPITLTFRFNEPMRDSAGAISLQQFSGGRPAGTRSWSPDATTLTVNYPDVPAGRYTFWLLQGLFALKDLAGHALDGEPHFTMTSVRSGDGIAGGDFLVRFDVADRIQGDFNLDDRVDHLDFLILYANFGKPDRAWSDGDLNLDTKVNFIDFQKFEQLFGNTRPAPTPTSTPATPPRRLAVFSKTPVRLVPKRRVI